MQPLSDGPTAEDVFDVPGSNLVHHIIRFVVFPWTKIGSGQKDLGIGEGNQPQRDLQKFQGEGFKNVTGSNDPKFAFGIFWEPEIDMLKNSTREGRFPFSPQKSLKIDAFEGDPVPIGWCTPFAGKRCRASWHRSFRNTERCSDAWTSENFITKYPV